MVLRGFASPKGPVFFPAFSGLSFLEIIMDGGFFLIFFLVIIAICLWGVLRRW